MSLVVIKHRQNILQKNQTYVIDTETIVIYLKFVDKTADYIQTCLSLLYKIDFFVKYFVDAWKRPTKDIWLKYRQ